MSLEEPLVSVSTSFDQPDLVPGTRIVVQSLPPPLSGRSGKVIDFDRASQAYVIAVDGGNPRTIYRENLRIMEDQSIAIPVQKRSTGRPVQTLSKGGSKASLTTGLVNHSGSQIRPGDQVLLCVEQFQFTLLEVTGIRRVSRGEPVSYAMAAVVDDIDVPGWMRKPPPSAARPGSKLLGFRPNDPVYAVWEVDGRWYPGRVRGEDFGGEKLEIEWLDKEAGVSVVKKSLVCRRTTFDDLRNKQSYLSSLNLASRSGALLKKYAAAENEDQADVAMDEVGDNFARLRKEEENQKKSNAAAELLFGRQTGENRADQVVDWESVVKALQVLQRFGIDGLVNGSKGEVFSVPSRFLSDSERLGGAKAVVDQSNEWTEETTTLLRSWVTTSRQGRNFSYQTPPVVGSKVALSKPALEVSSSVGFGAGFAGKGPLDIFHPQ